MKQQSDVDLKKYTTIHIGGIAEAMLVPETADELLNIIKNYSPKYFIGGGSNLLINDRKFDLVVDLRSFDLSIENLGEGKFSVGGSVRLQKLINTINEKGYGGIEYLYSVPGLVGGSIAMNAGGGRKSHRYISEYLISVKAIVNGELVSLSKDECKFEHRSSIFKHTTSIVVSALFQFPEKSIEETEKLKKDRLEFCKRIQDNSAPNFGTVFMQSNSKIMQLTQKLKIGNRKAHFSGKTTNWILNEDKAAFSDVMSAMRKVEFLHKILGKKCKREIIVWD